VVKRPALIGAVFALAVLALAGYLVYVSRPQAPRQVAGATLASSSCTQPAIVGSELPQSITFPVQVANATIVPNEPAVVATVNGQNITATALETQVEATQATYASRLAALPASAPAAIRAEYSESVNQIRQYTLTRMINNDLLIQEGQRLGLTASVASAQATVQKILATYQSMNATDPARLQFEYYLCAYHMTETSFATNPQVIQACQDGLTIAAVQNHYLASLPSTQLQSSAARNQALANYVQQLQQSGHVQIYLPSSLT
jgi:hypothetical protein